MKTRIYQIIPELDIHHIKFMGFADMRQHYGGIVPAEIYGCVYDGTLQTQDLEEIFKLLTLSAQLVIRGIPYPYPTSLSRKMTAAIAAFSTAMCLDSKRCAFKRTSRIDLIWQHRSQKGAK